MQNVNFNDVISNIQNDPSISEADKAKFLQNMTALKETKVNILITGGTGVGKSSTINALFGMDKAKVGVGVNPETMDIKKFDLNNVVLWDSPGLGDGKEADIRHSKGIISKLLEKDENGDLLIDLVLVLLDGGSRDLGTSFELITNVIIPNLGEDHKRLLLAINQADMAMKGRNWDYEKNQPMPALVQFLDEKVESTRKRILEATGVDVTPIYYSAGYKDETGEQQPYNLSKLLAFILRHTKKEKRVVFAQDINKAEEMWKNDDQLENYQHEVKNSFIESAVEVLGKGLAAAAGVILKPITAAVGFVGSVISGIASFFGF